MNVKKYFSVPGIFLAASLLSYPLVWCRGVLWSDFQIFTPAALASLAILLLTLKPEDLRRFFLADEKITHRMLFAFIPGGTALLLHYYGFRNNTLLLNGVYIFVLPMLGAVYYRQFLRPFFIFLYIVSVANIIFLCFSPLGLAGNWNWSAALLLMFPFLPPFRGKYRIAGLSVRIAVALCCMCFCLGREYFSRGAVLALALTLLLSSVIIYRRKLVTLPAVFAVLAGIFYAGTRTPGASELVRIELFKGAGRLMAQHPFTGVSPGGFESRISSLLSENYWLLEFAADRNPHPHNEFLAWGCALGIGGIILLAACFAAACAALVKARRDTAGEGSVIICTALIFFLLFFHGQLDTVLSSWPCGIIFLLAAGMLWGYAADNKGAVPPRPEMEKSSVVWPLRAVQILLAAGMLGAAGRAGISSWYARQAKLPENRSESYDLWKKSIIFLPAPENLYGGAMKALFERKDAGETLRLLNRLPETGVRRYLHSCQLSGRALAVQGKYDEAIACFNLELENYPLSIVALALKLSVEKAAGRSDDAAATYRRLEKILEMRRLRPEAVPYLLRHWGDDFRQRDIPAGLKR